MTAIPSAGLNLGAATEEEIREFLGSISADERQKVLDALKIVAAGSSEPAGPKAVKLAASYIMQATDGEWGFYLMEVKLNSDATGSMALKCSKYINVNYCNILHSTGCSMKGNIMKHLKENMFPCRSVAPSSSATFPVSDIISTSVPWKVMESPPKWNFPDHTSVTSGDSALVETCSLTLTFIIREDMVL